MAFNIVDLVKDQISDQLLGQMGNVLGTDGSNTAIALGGALPGLLAGLSSASSQPGGAAGLFDAARQQDDGMLGNMGALLGGGDDTSRVIEQGNTVLGSLLGDGALGKLGGVLANFAGISRIGSGSLMGMLAPIVIGAIKRKIGESNLDAGGLAHLLGEQRGNVEAAMPQGLMGQLQSEGFFDSIAPAAPQATAAPAAVHATSHAAPQAAPQAASAPASPHTPPAAANASRDSMMRWLLPVVAVVVVALLAWLFLGGNEPDAPIVVENPAVEAVEAAKLDAELPEGVEVNKITDEVGRIVASTSNTLESITDEAGARAALPGLKDANTSLGRLNDLVVRLPEEAQKALIPAVQAGLAALQPIADKALALPAAGPVIEPVLKPILASLQALAG